MSKTIFIRWQKQKFVMWKSTITNCNTKIRNDFILPVQYNNILYIGAKLFNVLPPDFKQAKCKKISRKSYNCGKAIVQMITFDLIPLFSLVK